MALTKRPAMQGLMSALPNQDDPLGIGVEQRAREEDLANEYTGSMLAPQWTGMLQAWKDQGVTRVGQDARAPQGLADEPEFYGPGTVAADFGKPALSDDPLMHPNHIATPPSLVGLRKARR